MATRAGLDHSTLHHYFATKQDLVAEVVAHATRRFWPTMPTGGSPDARLRHHLRALGDMIQKYPDLFAVLDELDIRSRRDPDVRLVVEQHEAGWRTVRTDLLRTGAQDERWADTLDPVTGCRADIATVKGVSLVPDRADIATVKGVSLVPDRAAEVLHQLAGLLTRERPQHPPSAPP